MRSDLKSVEDKVSRLMEYAKRLDELDKDWLHLKNQEDFSSVWELPATQRQPLEALYAGGRQDALNLKSWFYELDDVSRHPTLSSFVDVTLPAVQKTLATSESVLANARNAYQSLDSTIWSVSQMFELTNRQLDIARAAADTLDSMRKTNLYKEERGEPTVPDKSHTTINNSFNSQSIIQSSGASLVTSADTNLLFVNLRSKIQELAISEEHKVELTNSVNSMENSHGTGDFLDAYQKFMSIAADHLGVLTPFLPALATLLT